MGPFMWRMDDTTDVTGTGSDHSKKMLEKSQRIISRLLKLSSFVAKALRLISEDLPGKGNFL